MAKQFIREVKPHAILYRDSLTGIAGFQALVDEEDNGNIWQFIE